VKQFWFSCHKFTVLVVCDDRGIITDTAPVARKFIGQHFDNLWKWGEKLGGLRVVPL
jgi:hypothetical protein